MEALEDVLAAQSIMAMADLGRFDVALTAYGCTCLTAGSVRYFVSGQAQMVQNYLRSRQLSGEAPTAICRQQRYIPNHAGTVYAEERKLKFDLALKLQSDYPQQDLALLNRLAQTLNNDAAFPLLEAWRQELIGLFSADQLLLYKETLQEAYIAKKLTVSHYTMLLWWVTDQLRQVEDDILLPGPGKKTFWGFAVLTPEGHFQEYVINANYPAIVQSRTELLTRGLTATPLWQKTLLMPPKIAPYMLREPFLQELSGCLNQDYLALCAQLQQLPSPVSYADYQMAQQKMTSPHCQKLLHTYAHLWNITQ